MKKWLIPLAVLALLIAGATTAVFAISGDDETAADETAPINSSEGISPDDCSLVHNPDACAGEPAGDQPPIRSDEGIDPDECNLVHNIDACDAVPGGAGG